MNARHHVSCRAYLAKVSVSLALVVMGAGVIPGGRVDAATSSFATDADAGNNTFSAVFDAAIGERITAVSSGVRCDLTVDEQKVEGSARCSVPLTSIRIDNDDTKSEHFRQWATNKKVAPESCKFELDVPQVKLSAPVAEGRPVPFTTDGSFTICGRKRDDHGTERIQGTIVYLPAGSYGEKRTLRVRAHIEGFNRERYGVSPKDTPGWLSRIQQLAPVVGTEGTIDVSMFALSLDTSADQGKTSE
jgi:hypothetical protein